MAEFKIGDKVKGVRGFGSYKGHTGTVVGNDGTSECQWVVDFDGWHGGYDGHGSAEIEASKDGCYFVYTDHIEK